MTSRLVVLVSAALCIADLAASSDARASWPMCRHDAKRTGATTGSSDLASPIAYWRTYLGGSIAPAQLAAADLAGMGQPTLLLASRGGVVATTPTGQALWQTAPNGITSISGVADVDGDGHLDVIAASTDHVYIFSSAGTLEWAEPDGEMGTIGGARIGDLDGDGKPDLLIVECGCCGVTSGNTGFAYSFAQGFLAPKRLGALPFIGCESELSLTLVDADGKPPLEIFVGDYTHFGVLRGSDENILASTASLGAWIELNECFPANIDKSAGDELICLQNSSLQPATNQRKVTVLHYNYASQPPSLDILWSKVVAPDAGGDMAWVHPVNDLDGDGVYELVFSTSDPTNGWQTHIYDALGGAELVAPIANATVAGTAPLEDKSKLVVLTTSGGSTTGWTFARAPSPAVTNRWTLQAGVLTYPAAGLAALQSDSRTVLTTDLDGDGLTDLVASAPAPGSGLLGYSGVGGSPKQIGSLTLPLGIARLSAWIVPPMTTTVPQVAFARSDGVLNLLDATLKPAQAAGNEIDIPIGGYYPSGAWRELFRGPRLASLDGSKNEAILVVDSREALLRFDAAAASWASPPKSTWQVTHTYGPAVVASLDGNKPAIACLAEKEPVSNPPVYEARVLTTDGATKWATTLAGVPLNDLVAGNFSSDGVPDLVVQLGTTSDANLVTLALSGANGAALWTTPPLFPGGGGTQSAGLSVGKWNTDAYDDVYFQGAATRVLSGKDGSQLASGGSTDPYYLPQLYDTNGDGQDEVVLQGSQSPVHIYSHDLQTDLWASPDNDKPYPYGAIAACQGNPATPVLVEGSLQSPSRLKLTPMNGSTLGAFKTIVLANGHVYPDEGAARAAKAFLGQLTSVNVHSNLTGMNRPTAVVGSADGWLYGVNPCDGSLDFTVNLGAAVGEATFGDTDGDGRDEIIVGAADGYLYDLKNEAIAKPGYVWDTDPDHGITDHDVDNIVTASKLAATWAAVNGATGYAVAVVAADGTMVSSPAWQNVGAVTATSVTGLSLTNGAKYFFAVRALSTTGPSVDSVSNGVTVHFPSGADAGADGGIEAGLAEAGDDAGAAGSGARPGGCGCRTVSPSPDDEVWFVALAAAVVAVAGRRKKRG